MAKQYRYIKPKAKEKKKMPFEKRVLLQTIGCIFLFVYSMIVSHSNSSIEQKTFINKTINISSTKDVLKEDFFALLDMGKSGINATQKYLLAITNYFDIGFGQTESNDDRAIAKDASLPQEEEMQIHEEKNEEDKDTTPVFRKPLQGEITSGYGERVHPLSNDNSVHYGIDIAGNMGDCVISALPGTVEATGFDKALGNYVKINHSDTLQTVYGHLSEILVRPDEVVDHNTRIGSVGATGAATGPHLHLEVRENGQCVDPTPYLNHEK